MTAYTLSPVLVSALLESEIGSHIMGWEITQGECTLTLERQSLLPVLTYLRDENHLRFVQLLDICGVDYLGRTPRFDVVYHLLSLAHNWRLRLKIHVDEGMSVPSVISIYTNANWYEREAFDLYGISFDNHPDLRRILTDYGFEGHPLRKDFPLTGYVEVRYDETQKRVVTEPVHLPQAFRTFDFESPWQGMEGAVRDAQPNTPSQET